MPVLRPVGMIVKYQLKRQEYQTGHCAGQHPGQPFCREAWGFQRRDKVAKCSLGALGFLGGSDSNRLNNCFNVCLPRQTVSSLGIKASLSLHYLT